MTSTDKKNRSKANKVKRIALLLESDMAFDRGIARGVGDYIRSHTGWIILMDPMMEMTMENLNHWNPDGIITSIHIPAIKEINRIKHTPIVGFGSYSEKTDADFKHPVVTSNQEEIGRMAARHFINLGLKNFAFCGGNEQAPWCIQRKEGFLEELSKNDLSAEIFSENFSVHFSMPEAVKAIGTWLNKLPKPSGVFVFFDGWARWLADSCVLEGIQVPQEISILGVDNDRWLCELAQPKLSSVDPNISTAGYIAADILNAMFQGKSNIEKVTYVNPVEIVARDSSNFMVFEDPEVAFAMRYICEHACDPITPGDVLKVTGMSNSTAYRKFMKAIGRSIHSEIQRTQMNRAKKLLITTNMNVTAIAKQTGFNNVRYLTKVFRDTTGFTPTKFRRSNGTSSVGTT
jgi:LacI family transcriptional regulator